MYFQKAHNNDTLPVEWATFKNVTCNENTDVPCKNRSVFEILTSMSDLQFAVMYNSSTMHKFDGGLYHYFPVRSHFTALLEFSQAKHSIDRIIPFSHNISSKPDCSDEGELIALACSPLYSLRFLA